MPPRGRQTLAQLERQFAEVNARRDRLIEDIKATVRRIVGLGSTGASHAGRASGVAVPGAPRRRRFSAAARAKLRAAAKRRWAEAKKAGRARL